MTTINGDEVTIRITRDDMDRLALVLGFAAGAAMDSRALKFRSVVLLVNTIFEGLDTYTPYEVPEE